MSTRNRTVAVVVLACACALPWDAGAQARLTGADLAGAIVDQSGGAMPGVTVSVTNLATNLTRTSVSDDGGRYTVPALPPGTYRLTADITGFVTETRDQVVLLLGQSVTMDFQLKVAGLADLNGDGSGGAFPPDRTRTNPVDETTSVERNSPRRKAISVSI